MKKRLVCLLLVLMLLPAMAFAQVRMPDMRGAVTDDANVLSAQTASDLAQYAQRLENGADIRLHVALVHFLDGLDAQTYADRLFDQWKLGEKDLLMIGAAGEDSVAAVMGKDVQKTLGKANAENLLFTSSSFSALLGTQQYDAAIAEYCGALSGLVRKQMDKTIRMDGLFGQSEPSVVQQAKQYGSELWNDVMQSISESNEDYRERHEHEKREENGLTAGGWLVLIVLVVIMTRQSKAQKRYGKRRRSGCLGWIFGLFGINLLIDFLTGKKR